MRNLLALLFDPHGKISSPVFTLGIAISFAWLFILTGICLFIRMVPPLEGMPFGIAISLVLLSFFWQICVLLWKRLRDFGFRPFASTMGKRLINLAGWLAVLGAIAGFLAMAALLWESFRLPEKVARQEGLSVIECRSPFGSWFNMNSLIVKPDYFIYQKSGFFGSKISKIPYAKVRKVEFNDGLLWNKISISTSMVPFSEKELFIAEDSTFVLIKTEIEKDGIHILIFEEGKSLLHFLASPFLRKRE